MQKLSMGKMKEINIEELKKVQLNLLDHVSDFCKKNRIRYWLDAGTLLGAIRHKGYIPWDDDIDIGMLRTDYDRFVKKFNKYNKKYQCYCIENNEKFCYPYAKVLDKSTVLYEPDRNGKKLCVNLDVFVYDNAPDDEKMRKRMFDIRDFYYTLNILRTYHHEPNGKWYRKLAIYIFRFFLLLFPRSFFCKKTIQNSKRFEGRETRCVGNFTSISRVVCGKEVFDSFIEVEFEGKRYPAPSGYDEWLKAFYGDYMVLPSEEKRVSHHVFEAYYLS